MGKNHNYFEIIVGSFVLISATTFLFNSFKSSEVNAKDGYELIAKFDNIDGLTVGSDVKISGVKVGSVTEQFLDEKTYRAAIKINVKKDVKLSSDSSAKVASEGLLGSKYLAIEPGADDENLKSGEEIKFTQSSVNFEELLGKFIFSANSENKNKDEDKE